MSRLSKMVTEALGELDNSITKSVDNAVDNAVDDSVSSATDNAAYKATKSAVDNALNNAGKSARASIPKVELNISNSIDNATDNALSDGITPRMDISFAKSWKTPEDISWEPFKLFNGSTNDSVRIFDQLFEEKIRPILNKFDPQGNAQKYMLSKRYGLDVDLDSLTDSEKRVQQSLSGFFDEGRKLYMSKTGNKVNRLNDYYPKRNAKMLEYINRDAENIPYGLWNKDMSPFVDAPAYADEGKIPFDEAIASSDVVKSYGLAVAAADTDSRIAYEQAMDVLADDDIDFSSNDAAKVEVQEFANDSIEYDNNVKAFNNGVEEEVSKLDDSISESDSVETAQGKADKTVENITKNADNIKVPALEKKYKFIDSRRQLVSVGGKSRWFKTGAERAKNLTFNGTGENAGKILNMWDDGGFKQYKYASTYGRSLYTDLVEAGAIDNATSKIDTDAVEDTIKKATSREYMPTLVNSWRTGKTHTGETIETVQELYTRKLAEIAADSSLTATEKQSQMVDTLTSMYKSTARSMVKWNIQTRIKPADNATKMFLQRYYNRMQIQDAVNKSVLGRLSNAFVNMRSAGLLGLNFRASVQNISETGRLLYWYGPKIRAQAMAQTPSQMFEILNKYGMLDKMVEFKGTEDDILGSFEAIINGTSDLARVPFTYTEMYKNAVFLKAAELKHGSTLSGRELVDTVLSDFERMSISSGFMSSIGMADSDFGRVATMFYQYPIKEINYTLKSIENVWKEASNPAAALGKEGLFILSWLTPKVAYYLAMNWAGVNMTQAFSIFDPFSQIEGSYDGISEEDRILLDDIANVLPLSAALAPIRTIYFQMRKNGIAAAEEETGTENPVTGERTSTGFVLGSPLGKDVATEAIRSLPGGSQLKRLADAISMIDAGGSYSSYTGELQYELPDNPLEILNMFINGKSAIRNAQDYFGNADPYKGIAESVEQGNLAPLGAELSKDSLVETLTGNTRNSMSSFAPYDNEYTGQFDGSYNDKYTFRDAISKIKQRKKEIIGGDDNNYSLRSLYKQLLYEQNQREKSLSAEPTDKERALQERIDELEGEIIDDLQNLANAYMAAGHEITASEQNSMLQILDFEQTDSSGWDYMDARRDRYVEAGLPEDVTARPESSLSMQYARDKYYGASADMEDDIKKVFTGKTVNGKILPSISSIKQNYSDQFFALQNQGKYDEAGRVLQEYIEQYFMPRVDILVEKYGAYELTSSANAMEEIANYLFAVPSDYTKDNNGRYFSSKKYSGKTSALRAFAESYIKDLYGNGPTNTWAADTSDAKARALINEINYSLDDGEVASAKVKARRLIKEMNDGKIKLSSSDVKFLNLVLNMD